MHEKTFTFDCNISSPTFHFPHLYIFIAAKNVLPLADKKCTELINFVIFQASWSALWKRILTGSVDLSNYKVRAKGTAPHQTTGKKMVVRRRRRLCARLKDKATGRAERRCLASSPPFLSSSLCIRCRGADKSMQLFLTLWKGIHQRRHDTPKASRAFHIHKNLSGQVNIGFFANSNIFPLAGAARDDDGAADLKQANSWFCVSLILYLNWMVRELNINMRATSRSTPNNGCGGERDLSLLVYCVRLLSATLKLEEGLTKSQPAGWISMVPILNFRQRGNSCTREWETLSQSAAGVGSQSHYSQYTWQSWQKRHPTHNSDRRRVIRSVWMEISTQKFFISLIPALGSSPAYSCEPNDCHETIILNSANRWWH